MSAVHRPSASAERGPARRLLLAAWVSLLLPPGLASATDEPPPPDPVDEAEEPFDDDDAFEIDVEGWRAESRDTHAATTIDGPALERTRGQDLAEALAQVPGVTLSRGTADSTKPIIRGQPERRLLILFDGVRHESQKWGTEHATEIDPFAAGKLSVIKGAAGARYGPDAIGGVVLVEPPPLRDQPGVEGAAQLVMVSNGARGTGALRLDAVPAALPDLSLRFEGNLSRGASLRAPDYVLGNTGVAQWNLGATAQYQRDLDTFTLSWRHYDLSSGVCYCVSNSTVADFLGQLDADAPVGSDSWRASYRIDRPYQAVAHDLAMARGVVALAGGGVLRATYALQINRRREFEQARQSVAGPQYDFTLRTHSADVEFKHAALGLRSGGLLEGGAGASASFQENVYRGLPLIPNHRSLSGGAYGFERLAAGRVAVEVGGRYDHQSRASYLTKSAFERSIAREALEEEDCERTESAARCALSFNAGSVSAGVLVHAADEHLVLKLDLSSATRFPNGDELYMNGSAPTSPVYALGDPGLGVETTWGASPTVGLGLPWLEAEVSGYANLIDDYINFAPDIGADGAPRFDVTIRGVYPRFSYRAVDALFHGIDGGFTLAPRAPVSLRVQGSAVRATERGTGDPLLFIPPDRAAAGLVLTPPERGPLTETFFEISGALVAKQTRVRAGADLAPPPGAYALLGASLGTKVALRGDRALGIGVEGTNLLNKAYREYTSLLRYYADEPGRELRLRLGLTF